MRPSVPNMTRNNRLINTLVSVGLCVGLIFAYNLITANEALPSNTFIRYETKGCGASCPIYRIDVFADGTVIWRGVSGVAITGTYRYRISNFALRRMLRVFKRADVFNLKAAGYGPHNSKSGICTLTLQSGSQKISVPQACDATIAQTLKPISALDRAVHFQALISGDPAVVARLKLQASGKPKSNAAAS